MRSSRLKTLVLYAQYHTKLSYFDDWRDAFGSSMDLETTDFNICSSLTLRELKKSIRDYDLVVLLHSTLGDALDYIHPYQDLLKSRRGILLAFVGNEVNLPGALLSEKIMLLKGLDAEFIATQLPYEAGRWLFESCAKSTVVALPHALNPAAFSARIPQRDRKIDFGIRSYKYPAAFLGDNDRNELTEFLIKSREEFDMKLDIDFVSRFNRADWNLFLNKSIATAATEAGSFYLEQDDRTLLAILEYCRQKVLSKNSGLVMINKESRFYKLRNWIPQSVRTKVKGALGALNETELSYLVDQDEIFDRFFKNKPKTRAYSKAISSRHFDAIGTRTLQVMFPGKFNDILEGDKHYVALNRDFSNYAECIRKVKDVEFRTKMTDLAYEHIASEHTYAHRIAQIFQLTSNRTNH